MTRTSPSTAAGADARAAAIAGWLSRARGAPEASAWVLRGSIVTGDPMCVPPRMVAVPGVGEVLACAPETLFAWKLHGLCELGRGQWRAKDLCDLDLLWRHARLDVAATRAAVALAFSSRGLAPGALADFRTRETWGQSRSGARRWRTLARAYAGLGDFVATRARVRAALDELLG